MRIPTEKQRRTARNIIENMKRPIPKTGAEILVSSGYSARTAVNPRVIIEGKGVKKALQDYGFNEAKAKKVVGRIMTSKNEDGNTRLRAADMVFKVFDTYAPEKHAHLIAEISQEEKENALKALQSVFE